jgi:hypothetical protein
LRDRKIRLAVVSDAWPTLPGTVSVPAHAATVPSSSRRLPQGRRSPPSVTRSRFAVRAPLRASQPTASMRGAGHLSRACWMWSTGIGATEPVQRAMSAPSRVYEPPRRNPPRSNGRIADGATLRAPAEASREVRDGHSRGRAPGSGRRRRSRGARLVPCLTCPVAR